MKLVQQTQLLKFFAHLGIFHPLVSSFQTHLKTVVCRGQNLTKRTHLYGKWTEKPEIVPETLDNTPSKTMTKAEENTVDINSSPEKQKHPIIIDDINIVEP